VEGDQLMTVEANQKSKFKPKTFKEFDVFKAEKLPVMKPKSFVKPKKSLPVKGFKNY
jgi:hypothetical protein